MNGKRAYNLLEKMCFTRVGDPEELKATNILLDEIKDAGGEGLTAEFYYMETCGAVDLVNAKGKIVLVNGMPYQDDYTKIVESGALTFISFNGNSIVIADAYDPNVNFTVELLSDDSLKVIAVSGDFKVGIVSTINVGDILYQ